MSFDTKKFKTAKFSPRTEEVEVPELKEFFKEGKAVFVVRNLTGAEVGKVNETGEKYKQFDAASKALAGDQKEKITAFKVLFGISEGLTEDTAKKTEAMMTGTVSPECDPELAGLIRDRFPVVFTKITNKIYQLTGQGAMPGKPVGSGKKKKSKQA